MWDTAFQGMQDRGYAAAIGWVGAFVHADRGGGPLLAVPVARLRGEFD